MYIAESFEIAQYLDREYPDALKIFPDGTVGMQRGFHMAFRVLYRPIVDLLVPTEYGILTPASREYFRETREKMYETSLEDVLPKGEEKRKEWEKLKNNIGELDEWYSMSDHLGWGLRCRGRTLWLVWGEESEEWREIGIWHGGRWRILLDNLVKYGNIS